MAKQYLDVEGLKRLVAWTKEKTNKSTLYYAFGDIAAATSVASEFKQDTALTFDIDAHTTTTAQSVSFAVANVPYNTGVAEAKTGEISVVKVDSSDSSTTITAGTKTAPAKVTLKYNAKGATVAGKYTVKSSLRISKYFYYVGTSANTAITSLDGLTEATLNANGTITLDITGMDKTYQDGGATKKTHVYLVAPSTKNIFDAVGLKQLIGKDDKKNGSRPGKSITTSECTCYVYDLGETPSLNTPTWTLK